MIKQVTFLCFVLAVSASPTEFWHDSTGRIVGGKEIGIDERPFQISLEFYGSHYCGGSIVNEKTVVCAAHCTQNPAVVYTVRAGSDIKGEGGVVKKVELIINHPRYGYDGFDFDVSIIKVLTPFVWSTNIRPIQLASKRYDVADGEMVSVSGWGSLASGGGSPRKLNAVQVPKVNQNVCSSAYPGSITSGMICAGVGGKDSCQGDSGGPLTHGDYLVGIVSWGRGCALPGYPGVYTRVSQFRDFIDQHL